MPEEPNYNENFIETESLPDDVPELISIEELNSSAIVRVPHGYLITESEIEAIMVAMQRSSEFLRLNINENTERIKYIEISRLEVFKSELKEMSNKILESMDLVEKIGNRQIETYSLNEIQKLADRFCKTIENLYDLKNLLEIPN